MLALLASRAILRLEPKRFSSLNGLVLGLRKMRGIHEPSRGERRAPYSRDHERHFPDRGRTFHFDWNDLKESRALGSRAADANV